MNPKVLRILEFIQKFSTIIVRAEYNINKTVNKVRVNIDTFNSNQYWPTQTLEIFGYADIWDTVIIKLPDRPSTDCDFICIDSDIDTPILTDSGSTICAS